MSLKSFPSQFKFDGNFLFFPFIQILITRLLQNFANGMTAVLSWYVLKFVSILWPLAELQ